MDKSYLPSRLFVIRIVAILIIVATIFGISKLVKYIKNKPTRKNPAKVTVIGDLVQKDSNDNGIPDWEEFLWGLDPKKDGKENKQIIMQKKQSLSSGRHLSTTEDGAVNDNEILSKEYFAIIMSLMQSGDLNEGVVTEISELIGKKVENEPIPDIYTNEMLNISNDINAQTVYLEGFSNLLGKYEDADMGSELLIIAQGLSGNDPQALKAAETIAFAYKSFAQELVNLPVPEKLSYYNLNLANDYEKLAQSIEGLTQMLDNQLLGMKSILNYKKYREEAGLDLDNIYSNLE